MNLSRVLNPPKPVLIERTKELLMKVLLMFWGVVFGWVLRLHRKVCPN